MTKEQYNSFYLTKINRLENELIDVEKGIQNILSSIVTLEKNDIKVAIDYMYIIKNYYGIVCDLCSAYTYIKIKPPKSLYCLITKLTSEYYLSDTIDKIKKIMRGGSIKIRDDFMTEYDVFYATIQNNIYFLKKTDLDVYYDRF